MTKGDHMAAYKDPGAPRPAGPHTEGLPSVAAGRGDRKAPA
ncbi:MAG: hypothetical protein JWQ75_2688 [Pseudarthrobacter sp.]|nr:hypothetical protein [Pseudarthrobacter sp.]